jgi:hypothetical protein
MATVPVPSHEASLQVRQLIERDKELVFTCPACERSNIWTMSDIVGRFRSSPGATLASIQQHSKCPGCGGRANVATVEGPHSAQLLAGRHDFQELQARFVRRVLTEAGIDPTSWGYPPLDETPPAPP